MSEGARVDSFEALVAFKTALRKFAEAAAVALGDSEAEMQRVMNWLENEQASYWTAQVRKRTEMVSRGKEAVRQKKVFKDATGRQQSAIDEEKSLRIAERALAEAEQKLANVKRWSRALPREIELYKGGVQRFSTTVHSEIPNAIHKLDRLLNSLEKYVAVATPQMAGSSVESASGTASSTTASEGSMARGEPGEVEKEMEDSAESEDKKVNHGAHGEHGDAT
jgi:hypothetical protein